VKRAPCRYEALANLSSAALALSRDAAATDADGEAAREGAGGCACAAALVGAAARSVERLASVWASYGGYS
jgi:hypothetical protein